MRVSQFIKMKKGNITSVSTCGSQGQSNIGNGRPKEVIKSTRLHIEHTFSYK